MTPFLEPGNPLNTLIPAIEGLLTLEMPSIGECSVGIGNPGASVADRVVADFDRDF